jgi:hypothetical protein
VLLRGGVSHTCASANGSGPLDQFFKTPDFTVTIGRCSVASAFAAPRAALNYVVDGLWTHIKFLTE